MGKKIGILFGITAVLVFGIVFAGNYSKSQAVHVETIILQQVSEENTVTCTGKVENSKQKSLCKSRRSSAGDLCGGRAKNREGRRTDERKSTGGTGSAGGFSFI